MRLPPPAEGKDAGEQDTITKETVESYYGKFAEAVGRKLEEVSEKNISIIRALPISHAVDTRLRNLTTSFHFVALQICHQD